MLFESFLQVTPLTVLSHYVNVVLSHKYLDGLENVRVV